jgi:serine/threonine-protein kinase
MLLESAEGEPLHNFWEEIRRRNLHRLTAAYAVVAWILVQAAGLVFPVFGLPAWTVRLTILLLLAGLPVLWIAIWLTHPVAQRDAAAPSRLHHTEWVLIGLLALVLIASAAEFAWPRFASRAPGVSGSHGGIPDASIAVLAFENMSDDPKNEFFSEGISEELLNDLTQVRGLRVAGRTSSFSFKGKNVGIPEIGKALHVRTVLEGSVRREGNRVRITAQLVNAADDYHIWSQTYDRQIADIFAVQDEISRAITRQLTGQLLGSAPVRANRESQIDPRAYTAFLKGKFFLNKRNKDALETAIASFKQAIALKPDYAEAHANLALTYGILFANGERRDTLEPAQREAAIAERLAPDQFETMLAVAGVQENSWNWLRATDAYARLLARYPKSANLHHFYGILMMELHLPERWLTEHQRAAALDPLSAVDQENVAEALHALGRNDEAIVEYKKALALDPDLVFTLAQLCVAYADKGMVDQAKDILQKRLTAVDADGNYSTRCKMAIARREPDSKSALTALAEAAARAHDDGPISANTVGLAYAYAGDNGKAIEWFGKSVDERETKFFQNTIGAVLPPELAADPRWHALLSRPEFADWNRARSAASH